MMHSLTTIANKLGGYIGRATDPPPSIISLWRGWQRFMDMVDDYQDIGFLLDMGFEIFCLSANLLLCLIESDALQALIPTLSQAVCTIDPLGQFSVLLGPPCRPVT